MKQSPKNTIPFFWTDSRLFLLIELRYVSHIYNWCAVTILIIDFSEISTTSYTRHWVLKKNIPAIHLVCHSDDDQDNCWGTIFRLLIHSWSSFRVTATAKWKQLSLSPFRFLRLRRSAFSLPGLRPWSSFCRPSWWSCSRKLRASAAGSRSDAPSRSGSEVQGWKGVKNVNNFLVRHDRDHTLVRYRSCH